MARERPCTWLHCPNDFSRRFLATSNNIAHNCMLHFAVSVHWSIDNTSSARSVHWEWMGPVVMLTVLQETCEAQVSSHFPRMRLHRHTISHHAGAKGLPKWSALQCDGSYQIHQIFQRPNLRPPDRKKTLSAPNQTSSSVAALQLNFPGKFQNMNGLNPARTKIGHRTTRYKWSILVIWACE
jgi:hypothetical protein